MLKIGIVGLGGISKKAYLPYMRQIADLEWHLSTRNEKRLIQVNNLFACSKTYSDIDSLAKQDLDGVFIHVATVAHFEVAKLFLQRGIPVYMDKPLTEDFESSLELYKMAKKHDTFLMAGFNRRFAPRVNELSRLSSKRKVHVEKNDSNRPGDFTFKLFDFFIHPLDTALYLTDEELIEGNYAYQRKDGQLCQVSVNLRTENTLITASMNLQSGSRREVMEVQSCEETRQVINLDEVRIYKGTDEEKQNFGSWDTTLYKRGFETIIDAFLNAVKTGVNPVNPESSLLSHWICHQINTSNEESGSLSVSLPKNYWENNDAVEKADLRR